jgi:hypothetical protein
MSNHPLVLIADLIVEPLDCERSVLNGHANVKALDIRAQDELNGQLDEADAIMIYHLILNPHTAYYCEEGCVEFRTKAARDVLRALQGNPLRNRVN